MQMKFVTIDKLRASLNLLEQSNCLASKWSANFIGRVLEI